MKRWIIKNSLTEDLQLHNSKLINNLLISRGIIKKDEADSFLNPDIKELHNPFLLKDMDRAVERIDTAIKKREKVTIYGDYDVDGITSTSILYRALKKLGVEVNYYIPDRMNEGYGINNEAIEYIKTLLTNLIITVDCGITSVDEVEYAKALGMDIIITDHHECMGLIPDTIVINPKRRDCIYPFKHLAGCGVALKLVQALWIHYGLTGFEDLLDIAAIGTVADIVELQGENRIIVKNGLKAIDKSDKCGIKAIKSAAGIDKSITSYNIAYQISPRINAAGRLSNAKIAVELFTTCDMDKAFQIAKYLDQENKNRQRIEDEILNDAIRKIQKEYDLRYDRVIVLSSPDWHVGVVGIVASRLLERLRRPVILICEDGDTGRGSGRSIKGFNLFENLCKCSDVLTKFGGHELAAGLSIETGRIGELRERLNRLAYEVDAECFIDKICIDMKISEEDINLETAEVLKLFEPYGCGNSAPLLCMEDLSVISKKGVGSQEKHVKLYLEKNGRRFDAIYFNGGSEILNKEWNSIDAAFNIDINEWNSNRNVQLMIRDIKPHKRWLTDSIYSNYYRHIRFMLNNKEGKFSSDNINFIKKDECFLKDFAYFKKGYILISSYSSIKEIEFLTDLLDVNYNINKGLESQIIICPNVDGLDFGGNEVLIYDFLPGEYEYETVVRRSGNKVFQFYDSSIIKKINEFIESISVDEKIVFKLYDDLMYNEIIGTIKEIAERYNINPYKAYSIINYLNNTGAVDILVKKDILKIKCRKEHTVINYFENPNDKYVCKLNKIKTIIKSSMGEE